MSEQPIVHKDPAVQSNPFAKHLPDHVNAGAVAIEAERAIAEAQGKLVIAKRFPRDQARAYASIMDACKRPGLAEEACYSFPRGGQTVSGPSIRLAEMLAANWGNIDYGIRELSRKEGVSEMEAYCWDLETNTMSSQKFTVRHIRDTRQGAVALKDERDIYELTANMGGRRLRARILAILPADLIQAAVDECGKTLAGGNELPMADRVRNMVTAFKVFGVDPTLIEKRIGHGLATVTGDELADLRKIHNSIRDGISKVADWFGDGAKENDEQLPGDPTPRPEPPKPRARRGVSDVRPPPEGDGGFPLRRGYSAPAVDAEVVTEKPVETAPAPKAEAPAPKETAPAPKSETPKPEPVRESPKAPEPVQETPKPEEPAKEPASTTIQHKPASRAFLNDKETITTVIRVAEVTPLAIKKGEVIHPSIQAKTAGGFVGIVYHVGGAAEVDGKPALKAPWEVGAELRVTITGKMNPKAGKVQVFVDAVEAVGGDVMEA